jgi:hypothetical protein
MRKFAALIIVLLLIPAAGCPKKPTSATPAEKLVPNGREREILRAYGLKADSPAGQKRLLKLRTAKEKLAASRERMGSWFEAKSESEEATAQEGVEQDPLGVLTFQK